MADCEWLEICPFFNDKLKNMPAASDTMKKNIVTGILQNVQDIEL
jgi:hypothetical protein